MTQRRAVSTVITGLVALVAILGTTVYFMSGNAAILQESNESLNQQGSPASNQPQREQQQQEEEDSEEVVSDSTIPSTGGTQSIKISNVHSWVTSNSMLQECESLGIDRDDCTENSILAKKRLTYGSSQVEVISSSASSITAFAIQNTGSTESSVNSISLRGLSVPQENWYSCDPSSCGTSANLNTKLTADYNPSDGIALASGTTVFTPDQISLSPGQATIVYLVNAGNLQPIDAGNTYALQVQAGQATAVQQVQVVVSTS